MSNAKISRVGEVKYNRCGTLMKIVQYNTWNDIWVEFQDEYKYIAHSRYDHFKNGSISNPYDKTVNNVGYIGVGKYTAYDNFGKRTQKYTIWVSMLRRVYDRYGRSKNESYANCSVCNEWLDFQNFGKWYDENYYQVREEKMCLDKDILYKGNKIYCPNNCTFVPEEINKAFIGHGKLRGKYPIGVFKRKGKENYIAMYHNGRGQQYIGDYKTPEDAFYAYKKCKESYLKHLADKYKGEIPDKVYDALYKYEVEITD